MFLTNKHIKWTFIFFISKNKLFDTLISINYNYPIKIDSNVLNKNEDVEKKPKKKTKWGLDPRNDSIVNCDLALVLQVSS